MSDNQRQRLDLHNDVDHRCLCQSDRVSSISGSAMLDDEALDRLCDASLEDLSTDPEAVAAKT